MPAPRSHPGSQRTIAERKRRTESGALSSVVIRPLMRNVPGEPTVTVRSFVVLPPFMSLAVQSTVYSPAMLQLLPTAGEFAPNVSSPKSQ